LHIWYTLHKQKIDPISLKADNIETVQDLKRNLPPTQKHALDIPLQVSYNEMQITFFQKSAAEQL